MLFQSLFVLQINLERNLSQLFHNVLEATDFLKIVWYFVLLIPSRFINPGVASIITIFDMFFQIRSNSVLKPCMVIAENWLGRGGPRLQIDLKEF